MKKPATPDLITSAEVCELLNIERSTLSRWVKDGRLTPALQMPGRRGAFLFDRGRLPIPKKAS